MSLPLLATKLHPPPLRVNAVRRPRLVEKLNRALQERCRLTLICAPAGYGKSTLAAEWLASLGDEVKFSWLSLEEDDNQPVRFLRYLLAALQSLDPSLPARFSLLIESGNLPPLPGLLDEILNRLNSLPHLSLLVLDDAQWLNHPQIQETLEYLIDHLPPTLHLVLISRADPPLPLARLRARAQLTEIRASDLRFTPQEVQRFFEQIAQISLAHPNLLDLQERTEGWAVGLQLAALAMQHHADPAAFLESFRGSHRFILDYLAEEVLNQQTDDLRSFLIYTSPLSRFNADLCLALTGREDAGLFLERIEQANLFLIPLDDQREWYRYHHLFGEYLQSLLSRAERAELCRKAARWHADQNHSELAVRYALSTGDMVFAAQIIEESLSKNETWSGGNLAEWLGWLERLPSSVFEKRPDLSLNASRVYYLAARFEEAETHLARVENFLSASSETDPARQNHLRSLLALYRGAIASARGNADEAIRQITFARQILPADQHLLQARALYGLGMAYASLEETQQAISCYLQASQSAQAASVLFLAIHGLCAAAQLHLQHGDLEEAEMLCQSAVDIAGNQRPPPLGWAISLLGSIALERCHLQKAEAFIEEGISLSRQGGIREDLVIGLANQARLLEMQGNPAAALNTLAEISALLSNLPFHPMMKLVEAYRACLQSLAGQPESAVQWAENFLTHPPQTSTEFERLCAARILLPANRKEAFADIIFPLLEETIQKGHRPSAIEAMILLAKYDAARHHTSAALEWLEKALQMAAPQFHARPFISEAQFIWGLLPKVRSAAPRFVDFLLELTSKSPSPKASPEEELLDRLSEQEIRVLKLIAAGKSNREIAGELVISVGTAKWHVHNVLQKLGVTNRTQAIIRARDLGL
ncbi:MAG: LuxR C-terminal-related transcriptional regulator [Chloroflexota bacterium]